jgi:hypothetical protein
MTTIGATTYGQLTGLGNPAAITYSGLTSWHFDSERWPREATRST